MAQLNTIIVLRNDSTTAWEQGSYKLQKGEAGIEYLDNGKVKIKVGLDGQKSWKELPYLMGADEYDDSAIKELILKNSENINSNTSALTALIGNDTGLSVRAIAADEVNSLIGNVSDTDVLDSIKALVEYVNTNGASITKMQEDIAQNATMINTLTGDVNTKGSVLETINNEIAKLKIPVADEISIINTNNTFSIGAVSTDKLVQGNDEFVLFGGSATT